MAVPSRCNRTTSPDALATSLNVACLHVTRHQDSSQNQAMCMFTDQLVLRPVSPPSRSNMCSNTIKEASSRSRQLSTITSSVQRVPPRFTISGMVQQTTVSIVCLSETYTPKFCAVRSSIITVVLTHPSNTSHDLLEQAMSVQLVLHLQPRHALVTKSSAGMESPQILPLVLSAAACSDCSTSRCCTSIASAAL